MNIDKKKVTAPYTRYVGEHDLYLEAYEGIRSSGTSNHLPPILFVHGAYTGSWMWSKYLPHFIREGWNCYALNLRSHYRSRVMDMTMVTFENYLEDIIEILNIVKEECKTPPIIIGFSLGGILCQKIATTQSLAGLILIDSSISKEVNEISPYDVLYDKVLGNVMPAPERPERSSIDESEDDIAFQRKYLSMESSIAILACACWIKGGTGISINSSLITCPSLVIKSVHNQEDDRRGRVEASHLSAEYEGYWGTTHTGLLVGQRYEEIVNRILQWLRDTGICI